MTTIDELREELESGSYWVDQGSLLRLTDIPTDGPLFELVEEETEEDYELVHLTVEEFEESEMMPLTLIEDDDWFFVNFTSSGAEHEFAFMLEIDGTASPVSLVQDGEEYHPSLDDIPTWVKNAVKEEYGVELREK